jgi:molybdopterin/thiamine biosynthesis adenylyltransferase
MSLAKLGVKNLRIWDHDEVEEQNVANQAYNLEDIGRPKVEALADAILKATGTTVTARKEWTPAKGRSAGRVVFCMVDSMTVRTQIFELYQFSPRVRLVVDSRMAADYGSLLTYTPGDTDSLSRYRATLFSDDDAHVEVSACGTAITVGPTGDIISGYAAWAFINHAAGATPLPEIAMAGRDPNLLIL